MLKNPEDAQQKKVSTFGATVAAVATVAVAKPKGETALAGNEYSAWS